MARDLDGGAGSYLEVDTAPVTVLPMTLACWFNPDVINANDTLVFVGDKDVAGDWYLLSASGGVAGDPVRAWSQAGGVTQAAATTTGFSAGSWFHACAVFTSTTSRTAYINGGSAATNTNSSSPATPDRLSIGRAGDSTPSSEYNGKIAEVAIWNVALTAAEVLMLSKGYCPLCVRQESLVYYNPLFGRYSPEIDLINSLEITVVGGGVGNLPYPHPRMIYPQGSF